MILICDSLEEETCEQDIADSLKLHTETIKKQTEKQNRGPQLTKFEIQTLPEIQNLLKEFLQQIVERVLIKFYAFTTKVLD